MRSSRCGRQDPAREKDAAIVGRRHPSSAARSALRRKMRALGLAGVRSTVACFAAGNRRLCRRFDKLLPANFRPHLRTMHRSEVARLLNDRPGQVVLDVGAGRTSAFLPFLAQKHTHLIIGMDLSERELQRNPALMAKVVADAAAAGFPLRAESVDLIVSHQVVEHVPDNFAFFANCAKVLRPGGIVVHTFACRYAPFALINRWIPNWVARRLLGWLHADWSQDAVGFPAFYDRCCFSGVKGLLAENDFEPATWVMDYYQGEYFDFFFPLYIAMVVYDYIIFSCGIRDLAGGMMITARKKVGVGRPIDDPGFEDL